MSCRPAQVRRRPDHHADRIPTVGPVLDISAPVKFKAHLSQIQPLLSVIAVHNAPPDGSWTRVGAILSPYSRRLRRFHLACSACSMYAVATLTSPRASTVDVMRLVALHKKGQGHHRLCPMYESQVLKRSAASCFSLLRIPHPQSGGIALSAFSFRAL